MRCYGDEPPPTGQLLKEPRVLCAGLHLIEVLFDEVSLPKSPFRVAVTEGCDPSRVRAYGPGLEEGLVSTTNRFSVETRYVPPHRCTL